MPIVVASLIFIAIIAYLARQFQIGLDAKVPQDPLSDVKNFSATQKFMGVDHEYGLAIDEQGQKVCLITRRRFATRDWYETKVIPYRDVLASELFENGITVTKTIRSSQLGGALVGNILFGRAGAIIGGLSGTRESAETKANRIELQVIVNNTTKPCHSVSFLNHETRKDRATYRDSIKNARHWHALLRVLIERAESEDNRTRGESSARDASSQLVADELKKLADLRTAGVLSDDEFLDRKSRLLSS